MSKPTKNLTSGLQSTYIQHRIKVRDVHLRAPHHHPPVTLLDRPSALWGLISPWNVTQEHPKYRILSTV